MVTKRIFICYLVFTLAGVSFAQSLEDLEKQKDEILEKIEFTNQLLQKTIKSRKNTLYELRVLLSNIDNREKVIQTINYQIDFIDKEISESNYIINELNSDILKIKQEYAKIIYFGYKHRSRVDKLLYIFSAESFDQAYKRTKYIQQYTNYRRNQVQKLDLLIDTLQFKISKLEQDKKKKEELVTQKEIEKSTLARKKAEKNIAVNNLENRERDLKQEVQKQRKISQEIKKTIEKLLADEIKARGTASYELTPQERLISQEFDKNRGKLPWPTERGIITRKFGIQNHPVQKGVKINNDGIDIATQPASNVRSLFKGKVVKIFSIPGYNLGVIIRHGTYLTCYSNLKNVTVKVGQEIDTKQVIGIVYSSEDNNEESIVHLNVSKEKTFLNPEDWLSR